MAVSREDVLHIASLARIRIADERVDVLAAELNAILAHIEVLSTADTSGVKQAEIVGKVGTPLREDVSAPANLAAALESFAPSTRDGFLIVPRLSTHEDSPESAA